MAYGIKIHSNIITDIHLKSFNGLHWALLEKNKTWETKNIMSNKPRTYLLKWEQFKAGASLYCGGFNDDGRWGIASFSSFSSVHHHHTFSVQQFKFISSSQAFPPLTCAFVISHPQVRSLLPHFTLISFLVVRPRSALVPPPRQSAGRLASTYSGHDAAGERIHEGGGGKRDAVAEAAEWLPW